MMPSAFLGSYNHEHPHHLERGGQQSSLQPSLEPKAANLTGI